MALTFKEFINEMKSGLDGNQLADLLARDKYVIKNKTKTSITILVDGNRLDKMKELAEKLKTIGAKLDPNLKGSSIGGIVIGTVKILIKSIGKTGGLDVEEAAISTLSDAITQAMISTGGPINIKLKSKTIIGVAGVKKTAGTPKSDFHLVDKSGKAICHISHKKGSKPTDFQQWGGITETEILNHPEVKYFEQEVNKLYPGGVMPTGQSAFMKIKDESLKMMSVYGVKYNIGSINTNRVDVLIQGDPGLKYISNNVFQLTATGHIHYLPEKITGGFEPVLAVIYKGDRTQLGLKGARASIYPIGGRSFKTEIKNKSQ